MDIIAIDFETYLISDTMPVPKPVCLSVSDNGKTSEVYIGEDMSTMIPLILRKVELTDSVIAITNARFDLSVIWEWFPACRNMVMSLLKKEKVYCTKVGELLYNFVQKNAVEGASLEKSVKRLFNVDLKDAKENGWRLRYAELENVPLADWPQDAIDYAKEDALWTYRVTERMISKFHDPSSVRADFALALSTAKGISVDPVNIKKLQAATDERAIPLQQQLIDLDFGSLQKNGRFVKKKKVFQQYLDETQDSLEYTEKGAISTSKASLQRYNTDDNIDVWLDWMVLEKIKSTFLPKLHAAAENSGVIRATFNPLVRTGRTSSSSASMYPSLNLQQLPREVSYSEVGVRECFKAREGHILVSIDYASLELCSVAQQLYNVYGTSAMMDALNYGDVPVDLHSMTGAQIMSFEGTETTYEEFLAHKKEEHYKKYRQMAKPINLGYPGGIGPVTMRQQALDSYGVNFTKWQATNLRNLFYATYPELATFLTRDVKEMRTGEKIEWLDKRTKERKDMPEFAYQVHTIRRRGCSQPAASNGFLMQSLSAIGAKNAVWRVFEKYARSDDVSLLGFIHDELLLEIRHNDSLSEHIAAVSEIMISAMQEYMPDVRITVEAATMQNWTKDGENPVLYWKDAYDPELRSL